MDASPTEFIKPIETRYKGYRFRSRLEARWAVFFDHLNIEWQYEPERFPVGDRTYLPDFWLPEHRCWAEVKGVLDQPTFEMIVMAADPDAGLPADPSGMRWHAGGSPSRILLLGQVPAAAGWVHSRIDVREGALHLSTVLFAELMHVDPPQSTAAQILFREPRMLDGEPFSDARRRQIINGRQDPLLRADDLVRDAYAAARAARFEYGESGTPVSAAKAVLLPEMVAEAPARRSRRSASNSGPRLPRPRQAPPTSARVLGTVDQAPFSEFLTRWPEVIAAVRLDGPDLAEAITRAHVFKVEKQTVTLAFEAKEDRMFVASESERVRVAMKAVLGSRKWGVQCKQHTPMHDKFRRLPASGVLWGNG